MEQEAGNHVILKPLEDARHSDISVCQDVSLTIAGVEMYKKCVYVEVPGTPIFVPLSS